MASRQGATVDKNGLSVPRERNSLIRKKLRNVIGTVSKVMAGCFALAAFAVAIIAGIAGDNSAAHVLSRALMAMILCYPVGLIAGLVCERVIAEHLREHARKNPISSEPEGAPSRAADEQSAESEKEVTAA